MVFFFFVTESVIYGREDISAQRWRWRRGNLPMPPHTRARPGRDEAETRARRGRDPGETRPRRGGRPGETGPRRGNRRRLGRWDKNVRATRINRKNAKMPKIQQCGDAHATPPSQRSAHAITTAAENRITIMITVIKTGKQT